MKAIKIRQISPPYGMEIHSGFGGHVCISQSHPEGPLPWVVLNPREVAELAGHLQDALRETVVPMPRTKARSKREHRK